VRGLAGRWLRRAGDVREGETAVLVWSSAYFFFVLSAYYVIRPIRDEMGVAAGVDRLAWLFTGTLVGMLLLHPVYARLVARWPRRRFVPLTYRFFILNLVVFFVLFHAGDAAQGVWIGRVFYIWTSVFNLFVVSVFWSFMTDIYRPSQSRRLFGMVAVGGTVGAILGSSITTALVGLLGPVNLLLVSALLLEAAGRASGVLDGHEPRLAQAATEEDDAAARTVVPGDIGVADRGAGGAPGRAEVIGGGVLEGIRHVLASPYLLGIAALMMLFTIASTFLYFQQAAIVASAFQDDRVGRTRLFASLDLAVNVLTLVTQVFLTGRIFRWIGIGASLAFLALLSAVGFGTLGAAPVLAVVVAFQVLRRAGNFAIQRPAREVLYTVLPRTDKYKAKNFNDTFVYRTGDQVGAWSYTLMASTLGIGLAGLAVAMVPLSAVWLVLALWLGRRYRALQAGRAGPGTPVVQHPPARTGEPSAPQTRRSDV
jgi:AAA family ATP:ADP antiporter